MNVYTHVNKNHKKSVLDKIFNTKSVEAHFLKRNKSKNIHFINNFF